MGTAGTDCAAGLQQFGRELLLCAGCTGACAGVVERRGRGAGGVAVRQLGCAAIAA